MSKSLILKSAHPRLDKGQTFIKWF